MIVDQLSNAHLYNGLGERLVTALRYLQSHNFNEIEDGKHTIRGEEIYLVLRRYTPNPVTDASKVEAHRKYYDVQYVASGREQMGYAPLSKVQITDPYKEDGDYLLGKCPMSMIDAPEGMFFIFGPEDAHLPGAAVPGVSGQVLKAVVKVATA